MDDGLNALTVVGWSSTFSAFCVGLYQYWVAQNWKRTEFVASEVEKFFGDAQVSAALLLLDYNIIRLDEQGKRTRTGGYVYTDDVVTRSLAIHTKNQDEIERFSDEEMVARLAFDALLTWLDRFDHHIDTGLITVADVRIHLRYWVTKLADPRSRWKVAEFYDALYLFAATYEYQGALTLFRRFEIPAAAKPKF